MEKTFNYYIWTQLGTLLNNTSSYQGSSDLESVIDDATIAAKSEPNCFSFEVFNELNHDESIFFVWDETRQEYIREDDVTPTAVFTNKHGVRVEKFDDGWFRIEEEIFDNFEDLVEAYPDFEEARDFFYPKTEEQKMDNETKFEILSTLCTRDEAGRHFTEIYDSAELEQLEAEGLIEINRPVHEATSIPYDSSYWTVQVTESGLEMVEANL